MSSAGRAEPPGSYPLLDALEPPPRRHHVWRMLLGCLIVIVASAGATAVAVLEQVHTAVQDISVNKPLAVKTRVLAQSSFGQPETLLMIGDDTRSVFKYYNAFVPNLANEMLLIRIDPSKPFISMLSLPRELWVNITEPDGATYTNRLNSAYTYGTTTLLQTIKQVTGLSVNHVIATTFTQFENAIDTLGCVYDTVDERYYHNNADGGAQYQNINLMPGYQCLDGSEAEQFVSYRHTDTSQVRDARDQNFLLAVKTQYGPELAGHVSEFEKVFGKTVQTDRGLRSASEVLNLANLLISADGLRVRQVPFPTEPCSAPCPAGNLSATPQQIAGSVHNFLYGADVVPRRQVAAISHQVGSKRGLAKLPLTPTIDANIAGEQRAASKLPFTAEFPRVQDLAGSDIPVSPFCTEVAQACIRHYVIHAPNGDAYPIYVEAFSNGDLGQFYDVQGSTWTAAPLFKNPAQTIRAGGRTYELFYDGAHLETIAWRQYGAVYWVHNTLSDTMGNGELLAIAEQMVPVGAVRNAPTHVILKAFSVPVHTALPVAKLPVIESIGRTGGLITLVLLPFGLLLTLRNWLRVRRLRDRVQSATTRAAALHSQVLAAGGGAHALLASVPAVGMPDRSPRVSSGSAPIADDRSALRRRLGVVSAVALAVVIVGGAAFLMLRSGGHARSHAVSQPVAPTAAVAVLNAGQVPHAARRLALELADRHVHVVGVANLSATPTMSYEVLYRPGNAAQARLLAALLDADHPFVGPMSATISQRIGPKPQVVVIIPSATAGA